MLSRIVCVGVRAPTCSRKSGRPPTRNGLAPACYMRSRARSPAGERGGELHQTDKHEREHVATNTTESVWSLVEGQATRDKGEGGGLDASAEHYHGRTTRHSTEVLGRTHADGAPLRT